MRPASRRRFLARGVSTLLAFPAGLAFSSEPAPRSWQAIDLDLHDPRRARDVPVRLYLPETAGDQRVPLVMFSHGMGGSRTGYSYLGQHWATAGFASLHVQHAGSDRSLWLDGSPFSIISRLHRAAREDEAVSRVNDLRFALDTLLESALGEVIDPDRIAIGGHSYGANTALLAAGAQIMRDGRVLELQDLRIKAAILVSTPPFHGEPSTERVLAAVQVPTLHITSTGDVIRIPGYFSTAEDRIAIFDALSGNRKTLAVFTGGSHSMFTDRIGTGGPILNSQVKSATRELTTAFLQSVYRGEQVNLQGWAARHAGILSRVSDRVPAPTVEAGWSMR